MRVLQNEFEELFDELASLHSVVEQIIRTKNERDELGLTEVQIEGLIDFIRQGEFSKVKNVQIDEHGNVKLDGEAPSTQIDIGDEDAQKIADDYVNTVSEALPKVLPEIIDETSDLLMQAYDEELYDLLNYRRVEEQRFEAGLRAWWYHPFDLLEQLTHMAFEAGAEFNDEYREKAARDEDYLFECLTRLHSRGCQVAHEVLALLKAGLADGAHARWRTLHEIAVVGFFLREHGQYAAEQYMLYERIQSYKGELEHQRMSQKLGLDPIPEKEIEEARAIRDQLVNRFGKAYGKGNYGWAASSLGSTSSVSFSQIEKDIELEHLRPYYRMSSHNVHANPKGIYFRLGQVEGTDNLLLAGPTNFGLADPGHGTAISLSQITFCLLASKANIDGLALSSTMFKLTDRIGEAFLDVHNALVKSETERREHDEANE